MIHHYLENLMVLGYLVDLDYLELQYHLEARLDLDYLVDL